MTVFARSLLAGLLLQVPHALGQNETGIHADWPRWCGKVYEPGYPSFDPGGQTVEPEASPDAPLLYVQLAPRYSLYLDSEPEAELLVRTTVSAYHGRPLPANADGLRPASDLYREPHTLHFHITVDASGRELTAGTALVSSTSVDTAVSFRLTDLAGLTDRDVNITLTGWLVSLDGTRNTTYTAATAFSYLPEKTNGSVTRIDNLNGGFLFRSAATQGRFQPFFPYGYYASSDGFLANATDAASAASVIGRYSAYGLSGITPLAHYPESTAAFDCMETADLRFQFDLRESYTNLTWVTGQVAAVRDNAALFSYWSVDEPDGHQAPFEAAVNVRNAVRNIDPYHPVAVVLNCQNYYYGPYTAGSDFVMEDVYPIGINATYSKWNTAVNSTLGDCGCDNCVGGRHAVQDVRDRLDDMARYEAWLGLWPKTKVHNPQSFSGEGYWSRDPTPAEEWATALLSVNHGAQALISWVYPAPEILSVAHGQISSVLSHSPVLDYIVGNSHPVALFVSSSNSSNSSAVDVACWLRNSTLLVSVVNSGYNDVTGPVKIALPSSASGATSQSIESVPWGNLSWSWTGGELVSAAGVPALAGSLVILSWRQIPT